MPRWHDIDDRGQTGPRNALALWTDGQPEVLELEDEGDLRGALASLVEERRYLRTVLGRCARPIAVLDDAGRVVGHNTAFEAMVGAPAPLGGDVTKWLSGPDREMLRKVLGGGDERPARGALVRVDTVGEPAEALLARLPDDDGGQGTVVLAASWPKRARRDDDLDPALDAAHVAEVRHDAKGLLTVGVTVLEAIANGSLRGRDLDDPGITELVCDALDALTSCATLLDQLEVKRGEELAAGRQAPVRLVLEAAARATRARFGLSADALTVVADADLEVGLDRPTLLRVVLNLLTNAAYAVTETARPRVEARARLDGDGDVLIEVEDNGVGIEPDQLPSIFERDVSTRRESGEGMGIGLYVVRQRIEAAGGAVRAVSEPGSGTTVILHVPVPARATDSAPGLLRH